MILDHARRLKRRILEAYWGWRTDCPPLGDTIVILLTNPRSGSTWLFDMLRTHPRIMMHPRYRIHPLLGLHGRRYPRDLSNGTDCSKRIEVLPEQWELIPDLSIDLPLSPDDSPIHLEKIHPHFFHYDADALLGRINELRREHRVEFIYQVRDPKQTLVSFLEYKRRNPTWDNRTLPEIATHMQRIFETMERVFQHIPGPTVEYSILSDHPERVVQRLFSFITGDHPLTDSQIEKILHATRRDKKAEGETSFVGTTRSDDLVERYGDYFSTHCDEIESCYTAYTSLRDSGTRLFQT